ncbi:MAG: SpoIIE family protein phosphatase [Desulfobacterales bacterium]|nr:SpoIIE family protein phosphatase [Desulfobacterales bacterium]
MNNIGPRDNLIHDQSSELNACMNKVARLSNCVEIANLINSELSLGNLLSSVMETTKAAFQADSVSLLLQEEKTGDLVFHIALGDVGDEIKEIFRLEKGSGIAGFVAETETPVNIKDVYEHPRFSPEYDQKTNYRTRAMLCVPLRARGKALGVIQVMNKLTPPFIFTDEELDMLVTIGSSAAVAIDTAQIHRQIIRKETLERDLSLAREVQQSFLPAALPEIPGYDFSALNRPALEIGGDFYNFFTLPDNRTGIVLGDVSGKGIAAALFMARLTSDIQHYTMLNAPPSQLLATVNDQLCKRAKHGMFVTLVYLVLEPDTGHISFANAGHLFPLHTDDSATAALGSDDSKGPPLGILPGLTFEQEEFVLAPGQSVTLYTDGITEAKNSGGDLFGMKRLLDILGGGMTTSDAIVSGVSTAVDKFSLGHGRSDDITLLTLVRQRRTK